MSSNTENEHILTFFQKMLLEIPFLYIKMMMKVGSHIHFSLSVHSILPFQYTFSMIEYFCDKYRSLNKMAILAPCFVPSATRPLEFVIFMAVSAYVVQQVIK